MACATYQDTFLQLLNTSKVLHWLVRNITDNEILILDENITRNSQKLKFIMPDELLEGKRRHI